MHLQKPILILIAKLIAPIYALQLSFIYILPVKIQQNTIHNYSNNYFKKTDSILKHCIIGLNNKLYILFSSVGNG